MTIIAQDTFQRADQAGLGTASDGETWTQTSGTMTLSIVSNRGQSTGVLNQSLLVFGSRNAIDAEVSVRLSFSVSNDVPSLLLRYQSTGIFYQLQYNGNAILLVQGTATNLATAPFVATASVNYWMKFKALGPNLYGKMWADGLGEPDWMVHAYDTGITGAGQFGLRTFGRNTTDIYLFDSFTVTDTLVALPTPRYSPRAFGGTIIPEVIKPPLIYTPRALGATLLTDSRTFVPRAFGGVYIPDDPAQLWVPRALGGTTQIPQAIALSRTIAGVGTLTGTLSLATSLTDTIPGIGILTPTLSATVPLATTIPGIGTLAGTLTEATALSTTIPGIGTLTGTVSLATSLSTTLVGVGTLSATLSTTGGVSLSVTMAGVGTISGTMTLATALTVTEAGVGTLSGTLSANLTMPATTIAGVGTLTATLSASTALAVSLSGTGTLAGVFTLRVALSLTFAGVGRLAGTLTIPSLSFLSTICVTRDMQATAKTRDMQATCTTRDERVGALGRDMQATALTRDEQATAKTRS